ncbi:hypothetical protein ACFV9C_38005 [Kribbella sp. NPDC059898]|uniref:hypothetical protein n=1 Tax=Kribbella sp. NPDC059898 TaxID=3346995 RepID=UPI003658A5D9
MSGVVAYGMAWRLLCGVVGATGVVAAILLLPPLMVGVLGLLALICALTAYIGHEDGPSAHGRLRSTLNAVLGCLTLVAVIGLAVVLAVNELWLLSIVACTSPPAVRSLRRAAVGDPRGRSLGETTEDLCSEWRQTYVDLQQARTPAARLRVVMRRQRCLDELERRDPDALHTWLSLAASASGDPTRFFERPSSAEPPDLT